MQLSARELAQLLNGTVEGNPEVKVGRPSKIEEGGEGTISFLGNPKYEEYAYRTTASILLVSRDFEARQPVSATLVRVEDVYSAVAKLLEQFGNNNNEPVEISGHALIHEGATISDNVAVGPFSVIGAGAQVGSGCRIKAQVFIGKGVKLGKNVTVYPGARILDHCEIGNNCIIHANVVIGSDGFGFAPQEDGSYKKIAHVGKVIVEDNVEIGANTSIDRATMGATYIRKGVKLDNLIQIGHNVDIGENTVIAAQAGIAGSTRIGKSCRIGGQVGFVGHIEIADGTQIQAQSGIASAIDQPNQAFFGSPAIEYKNYIRSYAVFKKLPDLYRKINALEQKLKQQQDASNKDSSS
ncbi:MAG: UDP-3-O-(3-hydroxymyristoyl)glucosamine N-acyltransferase [Phaeodactylibacter sp.]|nr:UDP-3-O-(3-hydroxymyristoyl)glucosamine N-acyltransferase [Phaeodactylibacter sp.]MCB9264900.1 UDP-3-O-(3-hydroxymyristoyl)glucosamine N-acyltransferase [Lewinellaceae bacterium]MCB9291069.1 UDP-3-O-(3-hydroxymyristoyl)glucosamine N-acyltransferase [Lewinellaceae bacterium]